MRLSVVVAVRKGTGLSVTVVAAEGLQSGTVVEAAVMLAKRVVPIVVVMKRIELCSL